MKSALASLIKNLVLIGVLVISTLNFFYAWFSWQQLLVVQAGAGLTYLFTGCYEYLNAGYKAALPVQRYAYFTNSYLMFKVLKIAVFFGFAILLFLSNNRVKYLYPICLMIAITESIITTLKYKNAYCFVNIYANYLLLAQDKLSKIFAQDIQVVEFRHNILYLVKKNKKSFAIKLEHIAEKEQFINALADWLKRNQVSVSSESGLKLKALQEKNSFDNLL